ncbi:MAG: tetratricopeptide repeat protein, partial [Prochloraceae cyanobacterium]
ERFTEAESLYHQALEVPLEHFGIYNNLANILTTLNKFSEAQEYYEKALELEPEDEDVINSLKIVRQIQEEPLKQDWFLGVWAKDKSEYDKAISHFKKYLENHTEDLDCYFRIGFCYEKKKKSAEAIEYYKKVLEYDPKVKYAYLRIISTFLEIGNIQKAQNYADKAANLFPDNLALKLQRQQILPRLYDSTEEIDFYRDRFEKELDSIIENTSLEDKESKANALIGISNTNNFYLNYQGRNDVELHKKYGQFVHRVMTANYPDLVKPLPMPPLADGEKIRVGYVCSCFRHHSVSKLFLGWFENYDREKFEFHCYYPHSIFDEVTNKYKLASKSFYHNPTNSYEIDEVLKPFYKKILADKLHILVYLDIGQLSTIHLMAGLRLAPIQCQTWAHPITSGIPTIDYFLSSNLMEPENGQSHYAETLIRLPNIGVCFTKPGLPENPKGRSDLELPENATIYLCCQNLIKYLPKYDYIFAAIAKEVPDAKFTFLSLARDEVIEQFKARLQRAFASFNLDSEQYCIILPKLNFNDYLSLNLVSDIFLDSFAWSGGVTTLEAIACNLPVVTCPGEFMRGRHTYGILQMLGVTETIAKDEREYIEIAVRLGKNQALRANIADKIANNHSRLYGDLTCVRAVEEFYQRVVREYSLEI